MSTTRKTCSVLATLLALLSLSGIAAAHPGHSHDEAEPAGLRTWKGAGGAPEFEAAFVATSGDKVQLRNRNGLLVTLALEQLSSDDQHWIERRQAEIRQLNEQRVAAALELAMAAEDAPAADAPPIAAAFEPFARLKAISYRWDDRYFYVESNGIPAHQMMVGITAWQQQVPLPQKYTGANAWQIPLHPVPAREPQTAKNRFLRGAIALAVNGVPIFNPLNNRGEDAYLFGELDEFGGHCGRADDYHYHLAPVHLEKQVGKGKPIAYALDGYPIYGYHEPNGAKVAKLDWLNGHKDKDGNYHYHATQTYPYLNGGFYGEVTERDGQVDPQPRAQPVREFLPPLRGAKIMAFNSSPSSGSTLTYEIEGRKGYVHYQAAADGSVVFKFTDPAGNTTTESYQSDRRGPPGGPGAGERRRPRRPGEDPPPRLDGNRPPRRDEGLPPPPGEDAPPRRGQNAQIRPGESPPPPSGRRPPPPRDDSTTAMASPARSDMAQLTVSSPAFKAGGDYPPEFTCDGARSSPPIEWSGAPAGTKCFAINLWHIPDPGGIKSYWVIYNIPASVTGLAKNTSGVGQDGVNDKGRTGYDPMCSKGPGVKKYNITVYALSAEVKLSSRDANRQNLLEAIKNITLAEGTLTYQYERHKRN